jgi:DNA-binding transcriptional ArsR family regulator
MFNNAMNGHEMDHAPGEPGRTASREATGEWVHAHPAKIARIRRRLLDQQAGGALADTFKVLGDLTRVRILDALAQSELCVCDLAFLVGLSESAVSHQLRLLRSMRVVRARRAGRMVFYALDDEHVIALFEQGLRHIEEATPRRPAREADRSPAGHRGPGAGAVK